MRHTFTLALAALALGAAAQPATDADRWEGNLLDRLTINGYAQAGYTYTHQDHLDQNTFDMKRTLVWVRGQITPRISFLFMHDFSSVVQEYYVDYLALGRGPVGMGGVSASGEATLAVRVGQFKNALGIENPLSPTVVELIDVYSQAGTYLSGCGSDRLMGTQYGRDMGVAIYGSLFRNRMLYDLQLLNGQGINVKDHNNKKDLIAKLDYRPADGLRVVASAQKGYGSAVGYSPYNPTLFNPQTGSFTPAGYDYRRDRWTAGVEWKSRTTGVDYWKTRAASVRAEALGGRDADVKSWGAYVVGCVPIAGTVDAIASYDYFNGHKGAAMDQTNLVAGLQWWFFRKCRLQVQYTWSDSWDHGTYSRLQMQAQVAF